MTSKSHADMRSESAMSGRDANRLDHLHWRSRGISGLGSRRSGMGGSDFDFFRLLLLLLRFSAFSAVPISPENTLILVRFLIFAEEDSSEPGDSLSTTGRGAEDGDDLSCSAWCSRRRGWVIVSALSPALLALAPAGARAAATLSLEDAAGGAFDNSSPKVAATAAAATGASTTFDQVAWIVDTWERPCECLWLKLRLATGIRQLAQYRNLIPALRQAS
mmetsp:Transcript_2451/g.6789  ORF Transcript_2451/g.6789 Transcript_2451/m.6789 type:complete len:219 (-) Transcript_2451:68-724(-)